MHPALTKVFDAKRAVKAAKAAEEAALDEFKSAVALGEIELTDNRWTEGNFQVQRMERKTFAYSAAVDALKEQEVFEGVATGKTSISYRFVEKDA